MGDTLNKDKQIEEMAKDIEQARIKATDTTNSMNYGFGVWYAKELYEKGYRKASEVAEEIFAEIDNLMLDGAIGGKYPIKVINPDKYAELKKKYTEGEG